VSRLSAIRILAATAAVGALPGAGLAQPNAGHWVSVSPEGGIVLSLAVDPRAPSTIYAGGNAAGVFKSVDGGASWAFSRIPGANVFALAIDPIQTSTVYAGTNRGAFKSDDSGASWAQASTGLSGRPVKAVVVDPQTSATVYAATGSGVFRSIDGAASWTIASNGLGAQLVNALAVDPKIALDDLRGHGEYRCLSIDRRGRELDAGHNRHYEQPYPFARDRPQVALDDLRRVASGAFQDHRRRGLLERRRRTGILFLRGRGRSPGWRLAARERSARSGGMERETGGRTRDIHLGKNVLSLGTLKDAWE